MTSTLGLNELAQPIHGIHMREYHVIFFFFGVLIRTQVTYLMVAVFSFAWQLH